MDGFDMLSPSLLCHRLRLSLGSSAVIFQRALKKTREGDEGGGETNHQVRHLHYKSKGTHKSKDASWEIQSVTLQGTTSKNIREVSPPRI